MKHMFKYFVAVISSILLMTFDGCGMTGTNYGVIGSIYDCNNSNTIQGIEIKLYDSNLSDSTISAANGYYSVCFVYVSGGGCTISESFPEADRIQDFYLAISDIDGTNNGSYQGLTTNIGSIYNKIRSIDLYLATN